MASTLSPGIHLDHGTYHKHTGDVYKRQEMHHIQLSDIEGSILSSVVPPLNTTILSAVEKTIGIRPLLVGLSLIHI